MMRVDTSKKIQSDKQHQKEQDHKPKLFQYKMSVSQTEKAKATEQQQEEGEEITEKKVLH